MQNFTVRQATEAKLKHIKVEGDNNGKCIDAFALLKVVTDVEQPNELKDLLADLCRRYSEIQAGLSDRFFTRKMLAQL